MQILEDQQHRLAHGQADQLLDQRIQGPLLLQIRAQGQGRVAIVEGDRQKGGEQRPELGAGVGGLAQQPFQLVQPELRRIGRIEAGDPLQPLDDRVERIVGVEPGAVKAHAGMRLRAQPLADRLGEARLADAGLAADQDDLALALLGLLPQAEQQAKLVLASDQGGQAAAVQRLEAALGAADREHAPGLDRLIEALEPVLAEIGVGEEAADQLVGGRGNHDLAGLGQGLEPGGEMRGGADHGLFGRGALADQVADHDPAGGDADPDLQGRTARRPQLGHGLDQLERRAQRPFGVILMRPRIAEIGQDAIAEEAGDVAAEAVDHRSADILIGANDLAQLLGIELERQGGRADQIAEQDRELPPLGALRRDRRRARPHGLACRRCGRQRRDRLAQPDPIADREPQIGQVALAEVGQNVEGDVMGEQGVGMPAEAVLLEPFPKCHVAAHGCPSLGRSREHTSIPAARL